MNISRDQAKIISSLINSTCEKELNCNELLEYIGEYAEHQFSGKPLPPELELVKHHLALCRECEEEYETLCKALEYFDKENDEPCS